MSGRVPIGARSLRGGPPKAAAAQVILGFARGGEEEVDDLIRGSISEAGGILCHIVL